MNFIRRRFEFLLISELGLPLLKHQCPVPSGVSLPLFKAQDATAQVPSRFAKGGSPLESLQQNKPENGCRLFSFPWKALSKIKTPHPPVYLLLQSWLFYKNRARVFKTCIFSRESALVNDCQPVSVSRLGTT